MSDLELDGLSLHYPDAPRPALDSVTLTVKSGSMTALLGPSGCGKTTAMKLVAGLLRPDAGDIRIDGRSVRDDPPERRGAVMVFQQPLLFAHLNVAENVGFGLRMRGVARREIALRVEEMLARVQLKGLGSRRVADLSGGQQQRVALARALVVRPRVLLLDEPLSNLDAHLRDDMRNLIKTLQHETGVTTLFVTHDQTEAAIMADDIALILGGRLIQKGHAESLFQRPCSADVARFFGARNILPGQVTNGIFDGGVSLPLADRRPDGPATLVLRPEAIGLGPGPGHALSGTVVERLYLGTQTLLRVRTGSVVLEVLAAPLDADGLSPGASVALHVPARALWVLPMPGDADNG